MHNPTLLRYTILSCILFILACSTPEKPVTKEEAAKVAAVISDAMTERDAKKFNDLLDPVAFEKRILKQSNNKVSRATVRGAMKSIISGDFGLQIVKILGEEGTYELVKQYEKDNHQRVVFRMYNKQLNYHDYELVKKGNQVKIADAFVYTTGDNLTNTMAQTLLSLTEQSAVVNKVNNREVKKIEVIKKYLTENEYEKADDLFKTLPAVIRNEKLYKLIYVQIASGLDTDVYLATLNKFRQEYPEATNMYLLGIDAHFLKKDWPGALQCINSLDSLINKDNFLDFYRALVYKQAGDYTNQLACLERLHKNLPDFNAGMLELINAYLDDEQYDKAVPLTREYSVRKYADHETLAALYQLHPMFREKMEAPVQ